MVNVEAQEDHSGVGCDGMRRMPAHGDVVLRGSNSPSRSLRPIELNSQQCNRHTPIELAGRVERGRVGQLPYLLPLPGHGFYRYQLCANEETQ